MEVLLKNVKHHLMDGISLHYYTINKSWSNKVSATQFDENGYIEVLKKSTRINEIISGHEALLEKYDPDNKISLVIDEWGAWHAEEPGTKRGFLYQQNTLRDAFVTALTLNIFHSHARRIHMANIAQTINVLQAMILTDKEKMLLTPTYHVFEMYKTHMDARFLPTEMKTVPYQVGDITMDALSASASLAEDGNITLSLANVQAADKMKVECDLEGVKIKTVSGKILTAPAINSYNTFEKPDLVKNESFSGYKINGNTIALEMPERSIITLYIVQE
jgi:alpha-L-arabinofuranosidase